MCEFWFRGCRYDSSYCFNLGMPALPHVGDTLLFNFIRAVSGYNYFYIKEILYERDLGKTKIIIECEQGIRYNKFREFLLDKARFLNDIDIMEEYESRFYLDEMLQTYARKGLMPSAETIQREREDRFKRWRSGN